MRLMSKRLFLSLAAGISLGRHTLAQSAGAPVRLRGKVDTVSDDTLHLTFRGGDKASVVLLPHVRVMWLTAAKPGDIAKDSCIGTAAIPQPDGTLRAREIQVLPPSMRGVGEGSRPFDVAPGCTMTKGTIGNIVYANGQTLMPAKAASTAGAAASLLNSEGLRAIQAALAESTRVSEDIGAINDGRRQAEKADCRDTSLCRIARDVTIAQCSSSSSACAAELAGGAVSGRAGPEDGTMSV